MRRPPIRRVRELRGAITMNIRFVSSLSPEDEDRIAPGLLSAVGRLLDALPLLYTVRIETSNGRVFQHANAGPELRDGGNAEPPSPRARLAPGAR